MTTAADVGRAAPVRLEGIARLWGERAGWAWTALVLVLLAFLVIYPVAMLLLGALTSTNPVVDGFGVFDLSLKNFVQVLLSPNVQEATLNTLVTCFFGTLIAVVIGVGFAWIVARTDTPCKALIEMAGMMPLFIPPLVGAVGWSILGSPTTGILNTVFKDLGWDLRVNFYGMPGIIAVFGMYYAPYVYLFVVSALKNMDPALEEAAQISGVGPFRTMLTITFPLIAPAILSGMLLAFVVMLGIYGIPAV